MPSLKELIFADLYRYNGRKSIKSFILIYFSTPGFKYTVWYRLTSSIKNKWNPLYYFLRFKLRKLKYKFGYDIPSVTKIDIGFYIGHFGGIVISPKVTIGINCNISQGVTIGFSSRGLNKGYPKIKDNVYIGPGAVIIGNIIIGNNVAIGANSVVLKDVPDNATVAGAPARIVSYKGSEGYILNKVK